jgi:ATP-dependent exoDNAse (exonuclease V) beta subunit
MHNTQTVLETVQTCLTTLCKSTTAQWLLDKTHEQASSELAITLNEKNKAHHLVIDRTFVENGQRWIIDYKTSQPAEPQSKAQFLAEEKNHYQAQLHNYSKAFSEQPQPIKLALYFPFLDELVTFD